MDLLIENGGGGTVIFCREEPCGILIRISGKSIPPMVVMNCGGLTQIIR